MKKFVYGCFWIILLCTSVVPFVLYFLLFPFRSSRDALARAFAYVYSRSAIFFTGSKYQIEGKENLPEGSFLAVANHQNVLDIPVIICAIPQKIGFIAKKELFKVPMLAMWMRLLGCVCLDRANGRKSALAVQKGVKKLLLGYNLLVFPEGTRSKDGKIKRFKPGSVKMALLAGVPIVPITCIGTANPFAPDNKIKVIIHSPVFPEQLSSKQVIFLVQEKVESKFLSSANSEPIKA